LMWSHFTYIQNEKSEYSQVDNMVKHEGTTPNPILLSYQGIMLSNS
jgi:hypothetical protein